MKKEELEKFRKAPRRSSRLNDDGNETRKRTLSTPSTYRT